NSDVHQIRIRRHWCSSENGSCRDGQFCVAFCLGLAGSMGRFVLDYEEYGSGVARSARLEATLAGRGRVEFRRAQIDVAVSQAGSRRASSILESHRPLLVRPMSTGGEAGAKDTLGTCQDQVPRADTLVGVNEPPDPSSGGQVNSLNDPVT